MIISKISGGLGNQMFQYAIAKSIAMKNKDIFKLDISAYKRYKLHNGYRLNAFNIEENIANKNEIFKLRSFDNRIVRRLKFLKKNTYYQEKERTVYDCNVWNYDNIYLDGYWQNESYFLNIREVLLKEFSLKNDISLLAQRYLREIDSSQSVSIHVRRGDYLKHPEIGVLDMEYYRESVSYMVNHLENPVFYIFSNDISWCKAHFKFIEKSIFIEETESELEDMELMKHCSHNIVANSTFSWWGAWLNENEKKIVIAPKKWMAVNTKNYKWIPKSWMEI